MNMRGIEQIIPVIEVVEQQVQFMALFKPIRFWDDALIRIIELSREPTEHSSNGKVKLMMTIETCWVKHHYMNTESHIIHYS